MVSVAASLPASLDGMVANVRQLCPHERIEFFERLLRDCNFMEIRFIASLVENILNANYGSLGAVEDDLPALLSNSERLLSYGDKLHIDHQRRQLIIILCLLKSRERFEVTKAIADIIQKLPDAVRKMNSSSSLSVLAAHEVLLLFSLSMCHPAFEFSQKFSFYNALHSVVEILQPALGDGDKESCILLKTSFNDLVSSNAPNSGEKNEGNKNFKISQDEDIAFIQVDIPATSSPNGTTSGKSLKSVTVKTEKLVNLYAEKCVQQPSNPKTDPNSVLLKAKDGTRESVLHSALNAIVSDGGIPKLLEVFPQDAKAQMAEERLRKTARKQDLAEVGTSCSPDSDFVTNESTSPDSTSGIASGLASGSSASSLRGSNVSFDKKTAKCDVLKNSTHSNEQDVTASNESDGRCDLTQQRADLAARKLAPSAPPALALVSTNASDDSHFPNGSNCDWNPSKSQHVRQNCDGFSVKRAENAHAHLADSASVENGAAAIKRGPPVEYLPQLAMHSTDPKALSMYLNYAQACQTAAMLGMHPPPGGHPMWPPPPMLEAHHPSHSFLVPYAIPQHHPIEHQRPLPNSRGVENPPVQSSTPTPTVAKQDGSNVSASCDYAEKASGAACSTVTEQCVASAGPASESCPDQGRSTATKEESSKGAEPSGETTSAPGTEASASEQTVQSGSSKPAAVASQSSVSHQSSCRPPHYSHQQPPNPQQLGSAAPLGMALPNIFSGPVQLVPFAQPSQPSAAQSSGPGSRRGSVASDSSCPHGEQSQYSYLVCPPILPTSSSGAQLQHLPIPNPSSTSSFIHQRGSLAAVPQFPNPLPPFHHTSANSNNAKKTTVTLPSTLPQVTLHSVSTSQLFSIPPPPLPAAVANKANTGTSTTNSSSATAVSQQTATNGNNIGPVPVPFIALSNRDLPHALAFPTAFIAPPHVDTFSPPPPGAPASPTSHGALATGNSSSNTNTSNNNNNNSSNSNNNNASTGNVSLGGVRSENIRGHNSFGGQLGGIPVSRRLPVTGYANVHYNQRMNSHHSNLTGNLPHSQTMGALPRPSANVSRGATVNCFRCGEPGHLQSQCSSTNRRRTPYSGREFQINVAAPTVSHNNSSGEGANPNQDLRVSLSQFVPRSQQSVLQTNLVKSQSQQTLPSQASQTQQSSAPLPVKLESENALPAVVVTAEANSGGPSASSGASTATVSSASTPSAAAVASAVSVSPAVV